MPGSSSNTSRALPASVLGPRLMLVLITLALVLLGLVMVYSSSMVKAITAGDAAWSYVVRQAIFAGIGVVVAVIMWRIPTLNLLRGDKFVAGIWVATVLALVATALFGTGDQTWGAKRWLYIGGFGLQPAEFAKMTFVIVTAKVYDKFREGLPLKESLVALLILVALPLGFLLLSESDLGTTLVIAVGIIAVFWIGELHLKVFLVVAAGVAAAGAIAIASSPYRMSRLLFFLNPWNDGEGGLGKGWQIIHSFYAFSEGGLFGVGLGNSREKFSYLPMAETDFIYSIIGEELGLIGAVIVMALFLLLLLAGLQIAMGASDMYAAMIAGGIILMLVFQAFLNMGCAIGVLPTTGKPLPFISSGGSSMIASLMMIGLILAVSQDASAPSVHEQRRQNLHVVHAVNDPMPSSKGFTVTRGAFDDRSGRRR